jgi:drug/metabolite transporter (DMT)-like permease
MLKKKMPKNLLKGYILLLIATIIWGAAGPIIKFTLNYIPPFTFLFLRFLIATTILLPYTIYEVQKVKIHPKDYLNLFLLGLFSQTSIAFIFLGLKYTTAIDNAVIGLLGSTLSMAMGSYFYKEKISPQMKKGSLIASLGTLVVILEPLLSKNREVIIVERIFGNLLIMAYNIAWVVFIVWSKMSMGDRSRLFKKTLSFLHMKPMQKTYPPTLITSLSVAVGMVTLAPLSILEMSGVFGPVNLNLSSTEGFAGLLYMVLFSTIVAYICYQKSLKDVKVNDTAFFGYLAPIFTLPVAYILLGEIPNIIVLLGAGLIATGVLIAEKSNNSL